MIAVLFLLFSGVAEAENTKRLRWDELEVGRQLTLTQDVVLGGHPFQAGISLRLEDRDSLEVPGAPISFYALRQLPCAEPDSASTVETVLPAGNEENSAVGVELSEGCYWGIYVEDKDLFTDSFLRLGHLIQLPSGMK